MRNESENKSGLIPVQINHKDLVCWKSTSKTRFHWVQLLFRYLPRGKGWIPRKIGKAMYRNKKGLMKLPNGALLAVEPTNLDAYVSRCDHPGCTVTKMCESLLAPGNTFFDIGASIGSVSLALAYDFKDQIHIHAFEPQTTISWHCALSAAVNAFSNVTVYQNLIGEEDGKANLFVPEVTTFASLLPLSASSRAVTCQMVTLDREVLLLKSLPVPDVIKIDVEGGELHVLKGSKRVIGMHRPYIVLEADEKLRKFGTSRRELLGYLRTLADYRFYWISPDPKARNWLLRLEEASAPDTGGLLAAPACDVENQAPILKTLAVSDHNS